MTEARKASLMAYCRIDAFGPGEEALFQAMYDSSVSYMDQAGVAEPPEGTARRAQYDLCVNALVLDGWDNRGTAEDSRLMENPAFRRSLNQLKLTEPDVSDLDTSG